MTASDDKLRLDDAVAAVRDEEIDLRAAEAARARVWDRLARTQAASVLPDTIRGCDDVRALLEAHGRRELPAARALLVEDHLRECASCRSAAEGRREAIAPWHGPATLPTRTPLSWQHAVAASVLLATGVAAYRWRDALLGVPPGSRAGVHSISGMLYRVADRSQVPLRPGDEIAEGDAVRTGPESQAVLRLRDGSTLEMGERAELSVSARRRDTTVHLVRGNVIVEAAKRRSGHLYVAAADCTVSVTGTVFSVSRGVKGSRVAVLEGEVRVEQAGTETVLRPGQQLATSKSLTPVPIRQEIAWSRNVDRHLALLAALSSLRQDLEQVQTPGLRYESRLLRGVPGSAVVYVAAPNYGSSIGEAYRLFEERALQSPVLRSWWQQQTRASRGPNLSEVVGRLQRLGAQLGDELVAAFVPGKSEHHHVLFLAELRTGDLRAFLEDELFADLPGKRPRLAFVAEDAVAPPAGTFDLYVLLRPDVAAVSDDWTTLRAAAACLDGAACLAGTPFGARVQEAYGDGTQLLVAADASRLAGHQQLAEDTGLADLQYFIAERSEDAGTPHNTAELLFSGPRRGVASWLAAPAPMGSLDFISPEATGVVSCLTKKPLLIFDDILAFALHGAGAERELAQLEAHLNVRLREDVAAALGSEFTLALDGPLVPTPAFKLVAEVNDPARLEAAFEALVEAVNREASQHGRAGLGLDHEQVGEHTLHALRARSGQAHFEVHYAFADGYLVAAPSRALVVGAIAVRDSGRTLSRSTQFTSLLAADGRSHVSALLYQNIGTAAASLGSLLESLSPQQRSAFESLTSQAKPRLVYAYGEEDRIVVAGDLFGLDPSSLALPAFLARAPSARRPVARR